MRLWTAPSTANEKRDNIESAVRLRGNLPRHIVVGGMPLCFSYGGMLWRLMSVVANLEFRIALQNLICIKRKD